MNLVLIKCNIDILFKYFSFMDVYIYKSILNIIIILNFLFYIINHCFLMNLIIYILNLSFINLFLYDVIIYFWYLIIINYIII